MFKVSVIISAKNEQEHILKTIYSMLSNTSYRNYEIIVINDGSEDNTEKLLSSIKVPNVKTIKTNGIGTAKARNFGTKFANGDLFIFSDAHITVPSLWLENIISDYKKANTNILSVGIGSHIVREVYKPGFGQTLKSDLNIKWFVKKPEDYIEIPIAAGGFVLFEKKCFFDIEGFDNKFETWGYEDVEISIKAWLRGYKIKITPNIVVKHFFRETTPFKVDPVEFYFNRYRTALLHFNEKRTEKLLNTLSNIMPKKNIDFIIEKSKQNFTLKDREIYLSKQKYSDDWFFQKFRINF